MCKELQFSNYLDKALAILEELPKIQANKAFMQIAKYIGKRKN